ncbi:hypothetical protein BHE74_00008906 [Ensete ventricosum]|uniref:Uncharacterized protein n=1 Tax=Ensete ventricosum TaxID=4639 RepID=A0A426YZR9_ENSVE|nr:hypothetical protein B296_00014174 [Ensete ventricosum]RWW82608.1 hypothetical protein BHE74_00008906 [Ensete ventricosum]
MEAERRAHGVLTEHEILCSLHCTRLQAHRHDFLGRWGDEVDGVAWVSDAAGHWIIVRSHGRTAMTSDLETFSRRERFVDSLVSLLPRMLTQAMTARTDQREEDEN